MRGCVLVAVVFSIVVLYISDVNAINKIQQQHHPLQIHLEQVQPKDDQPVKIATKYGTVVGNYVSYAPGNNSGDFIEFKGIPFASPPVGQLRWQSPAPPAPWSTPLQTTEFGPACMQECFEPKGICPDTMSEDCLYLNVYAPAKTLNVTRVPVMVFFHGGNYRQDSASTDLYWGDYIVNTAQIVLVTVNYRIGAFGFVVTNFTNGNLGLQDQRLGLQWVQDNIAYFGGDPTNVTIFGQSAGADSVLTHMYSPPSMGKGLFHRVIAMSPSLGIAFKTVDEQISTGKDFAKELGCDYSNIACFYSKTSAEVLTAQLATKPFPWPNTFKKAYTWSPSIGSAEVPYQMLDAFGPNGNYEKVPVIMGSLLEEGIQFVDLLFPHNMSKLEYYAAIIAVFGIHAEKILQTYPCLDNETSDCRVVMAEIATHKVFSCAIRYQAKQMKQSPEMANNLWVYYYDHPLSFPGWGANFSYCNGHVCHGSELPVLFESATSYGFNFDSAELVLAQQMQQLFSAFAHGETVPFATPTPSVVWPLFTPTNVQTLRLDTGGFSIQTNRLEDLCNMWDTVGYY